MNAAALLIAASLTAPLGLTWGQSPATVDQELRKKFTPVEQGIAVERFLDEFRYAGQVLGMPTDHVAPLFFTSQLFGVAVNFTPTTQLPAAMIWEQAVERLTAAYGQPAKRTKPIQLLSWNAILRVLPPEANQTEIMRLYNAAEADPNFGRFFMNDLQIQVGLWVPEAIWYFDNGAVAKVVMRAGGNGPYGLRNLKPGVMYMRYEQLR